MAEQKTTEVQIPADYTVPKEIQFIFSHFAPIFATIDYLLIPFADAETKVNFLRTAMEPYATLFEGMIRSQRKLEESDSLPMDRAIRMFGIRPTYDLLVSLELYKAITGTPCKWPQNGKPEIQPKQYLNYALGLLDEFGEDSHFSFEIYVTGLAYDILNLLCDKHAVSPRKTKELLATQYKDAIKLAKVGLEKGKTAKGLALEKFLISTILLKRSGRIIFSMLNDEYGDFAKSLTKVGFRSRFAHISEREAFKISNNMISCALAKFIPFHNAINGALLFFDYSYLLNDKFSGTKTYELVSLVMDLSA